MQNCPQRFYRIGNICTVSPQCEFLCAPENGEGKNDDDDGDGDGDDNDDGDGVYLEVV